MKCQKCGTQNQHNATFCASCGTKLMSSPIQSPGISGSPRSGGVSSKTMISPISHQSMNSNSTDFIIGRDSKSDIVLNDPSVSTKHARIYLDDEKVYIEDLKSLNGTFVNGRRIATRQEIGLGDKVYIANVQLNMNSQGLYNLLSQYGSSGLISNNSLNLRFNNNWLGKIFFFSLIVLFLLPWTSFSALNENVSISALDYAFNNPPPGTKVAFTGYGPLNTYFLVLFLLVIAGIIMNFFTLKISKTFNYVNILSIVLFVLALVYFYMTDFLSREVDLKIVVIQNNFSVYIFILIVFISIFEGYLEDLLKRSKV